MKNKLFLSIKLLVLLGIIALSFWLRLNNFDKVPLQGQSQDEYSNSWVGLSLIRLGVPVGISGIDGYDYQELKYINVDRIFQLTAKGNPLPINMPWFDHPPALGLITGGWAYFKGARNFEDTSVTIIRKPMVYIGTVTVALLIIYGWLNFSYTTGIIAGLVYATSPLVVIGSRMIQAENGFIPLFLLTLIVYGFYEKTKKIGWLFAAGLISGLAMLFKLSAISVVITVIFLLFQKNGKKYRYLFSELFIFLVPAITVASLFIVYGLAFDALIFKNILFSNSNRFYGIGPSAIFELLKQTKITNDKYITEAWPLIGWLAFFVSIINVSKKTKWIIMPILAYLLTYLFFGSQPFGWYMFPFLPFLALALGWLITSFKKPSGTALSLLLTITMLGVNVSRLVDINSFQKSVFWWRWGTVGLFGVLLFLISTRTKNKLLFLRVILFILLLFSLYLATRYCLLIDVDYWYKVS